MSKPISTKQLDVLAEVIREWPMDEKLTWNAICQAAELELSYVPTRQALSNKAILVNAYKKRKEEIKSRHSYLTSTPAPKSMAAAVDQIIRLKQENERLKSELSRMAAVAQRFIHNASLHGLSQAKLMAPPPKVNRRT